MHRSRLSVLVILAAGVAACSRNDAATEGTDALAQDRALIARLEVDQETRQQPLPAACGTVALAAQPALANQQQARELTRQARDAEMQGNVKEARSLLIRASELDGTNKSTAYHLGRTNEALGDRTAAIAAYCRYLALTPTLVDLRTITFADYAILAGLTVVVLLVVLVPYLALAAKARWFLKTPRALKALNRTAAAFMAGAALAIASRN